MFKKKGAPAFKPKIPSARPRLAAPAPGPVPVAKPIKAPAAIDEPVEETPVDTSSARRPSYTAPETQKQETQVLQTQIRQQAVVVESSQPRPRRRSSAASTSKAVQDSTALVEIAKNNVEAVVEEIVAEVPAPTGLPESTPATSRRQGRPRRVSQAAQVKPTVETLQLETPPATDAPVSEPASESQPEAPAAQLPRTTRGRRRKSTTTDATGEASEASTTRPKKRTKKTPADGEGTTPAAAKSRKRSTAATTATGEKAPTRPRRARSATPEDSETRLVDLQTLKMSDLTRDLHIGKKFSRHDELRERERKARLQAKLIKEGLTPNGSRSSTPLAEQTQKVKAGTPGSATPSGANSDAGGGGPAPAGPQFRIVDGQIVVDQSSLVMDRHARAAAAQAGEDMETIEENDFTRLITSSSFMTTSKLRGPNIWTDDETELFYRGLSMFGTEFQMISHMFPGKQRRHVKLKFNREERYNPARIDAALIGEKTTKMDLEEYKTLTGTEFESVESIMAEQRKIEEEYEAERQRVVDEQAEIMRKKKEELFADDDKNATGKKKGKKRGKQAVRYGLNGEPILDDA